MRRHDNQTPLRRQHAPKLAQKPLKVIGLLQRMDGNDAVKQGFGKRQARLFAERRRASFSVAVGPGDRALR